MDCPRRILFHRYYEGFSGGHLKLKDYIDHTLSVKWLEPLLFVDSSSQSFHLWNNHRCLTKEYSPMSADIVFVAGIDWRALNNFIGIEYQKPIINLIQHVRHADPGTELYSYLSRKAIRICVSQEVADAIANTKVCNGAIYTIQNGVELRDLNNESCQTCYDVAIAGLKNPKLAFELDLMLTKIGMSVLTLTRQLPRDQYLSKIKHARVVITLPNHREGFYLPALEAMVMEIPLVCPDCIGNRSFCRDNDTCLMPSFDASSIVDSALELLRNDELANRLKHNAKIQSSLHSLESERKSFLEILSTLA